MFFSPLSGHSLLGSLCHHHPLPLSQYSTGFSVACFWMFSIEFVVQTNTENSFLRFQLNKKKKKNPKISSSEGKHVL
jgi:hypothetical protein